MSQEDASRRLMDEIEQQAAVNEELTAVLHRRTRVEDLRERQ